MAQTALELRFGYLSALRTAQDGYYGGYLLVTLRGRPIEFHCTSPVLPSRAQEILYGPALEPYLIGEQLAGALLAAAKTEPTLILTDQAPMLADRAANDAPIVLVHREAPGESVPESGPSASLAAAAPWSAARQLRIGNCWLELSAELDREQVSAHLNALAEHVELAEPFERIHEAIREAQRLGARSSEAHEQAA